MPINIDAEDFLKIIKDNTFQKIFIGIVLVLSSFYAGKISNPECKQSVICKDISDDRDRLSAQLKEQYKVCQKEKALEIKEAVENMKILCADRVDKALEGCEFSEDIHCPICIARGVCKP